MTDIHISPAARADRAMNRAAMLSAALGLMILAGTFAIQPAQARSVPPPEMVMLPGYPPGTILIRQGERRLYLMLDGGAAIRYPVGVGKAGKRWQGEAAIDGKYVNPAWSPPAEVKRDRPWLPNVIAGGTPSNPMGVRALTLSGGEYAIHGTNVPESVGTFASYGCFRMLNRDIVDLYDRVRVGTRVIVTP